MDEQGAETTGPRVTTVADHAWKIDIEPYAEHSPVLDIPAGVVACQFCGNTRFRRSRFRVGDLVEALLLRLPLRCMRCNQRQYGYFLAAGVAVGSRTRGPRLVRKAETWQAWTELDPGDGLQRPMTTVVGTKATKLKRPSEVRPRSQANLKAPTTPAWRDEDRHIW